MKNNKGVAALFFFLILFIFMTVMESLAQERYTESKAQTARLQWWREAKFGMFIHWGLYSIPEGVWKDKEKESYGEWIMYHAQIPVKEYEQLSKQFNPQKFNADAWVRLAKQAGMKYMVITAKHHDGFALFDSKADPFNIIDATPFKRDVIKELANACKKAGLRFGCYYSIDRDWHHPDAQGNELKQTNFWDYPDESKKDFNNYLQKKALPQVRELLSGYGPLGIIWFDGIDKKTADQNETIIKMVRQLQPECLINSRLGNWTTFVWGDYRSMGDNEVADQLLPYGWENPGTLNDTYAYKKNDHNWKTAEEVIQMLVDIVSKGGNYLLNVGPKATGVIPSESVRILQEVGKWLDIHGESIYGTSGSPFGTFDWGRCTLKPGKLYLHIFEWPTTDELVIANAWTSSKKAYLFKDPQKNPLQVRSLDNGELRIRIPAMQLPAQYLDANDTVVVVEIE